MNEAVVTMSTKLPAALRDAFVALAKARGMTSSALLRRLIELELAGAPDGEQPGEVECAVRDEITERLGDVTGARAATAVNLARRMDRDPTSGAQNASQLRFLLGEIAPPAKPGPAVDFLVWLKISREFKYRNWEIVDEDGDRFALSGIDRDVARAIMAAVSGGVKD